MKNKPFKLLFILAILSIGVYAGVQWIRTFLCEVNVKCKNCTRTSNSKEESKEKGFYLMDYKPIYSEVKLKYHDEKITFTDTWVETQWYSNTDDCLNHRLEKRKGYNIIFEFDKSNKGSFVFGLSPVLNGEIDISNGGISESRKQIRLDYLADTLWLQVEEKNPVDSIGWKKGLKSELIGFVRK